MPNGIHPSHDIHLPSNIFPVYLLLSYGYVILILYSCEMSAVCIVGWEDGSGAGGGEWRKWRWRVMVDGAG